jgi:hypothetical protein
VRALKAPDALRALNMAAGRTVRRDQQQERCERDLGAGVSPISQNSRWKAHIGRQDCQTAAPVPCLRRWAAPAMGWMRPEP